MAAQAGGEPSRTVPVPEEPPVVQERASSARPEGVNPIRMPAERRLRSRQRPDLALLLRLRWKGVKVVRS